jgi:hypothetical protein
MYFFTHRMKSGMIAVIELLLLTKFFKLLCFVFCCVCALLLCFTLLLVLNL